MTEFFQSLFGLFLSPFGLVGLAALDSSMLFFLPIAVDAALVILSARHREIFWVFPLLATVGSLIGTTVTFWVGSKIGENSLENWIPKKRLEQVRCKIKNKGAIAMAVPALLPPPFPLTPFVLACGALSVSRTRFFVTFGMMRILRFGAVSLLGWIYGRKILAVFESDIFKGVVALFILVALVGSGYTAYRLVVTTRSHRNRGKLSRATKDAA
jgi:membrane protein YqaA with SNARE-associated domain